MFGNLSPPSNARGHKNVALQNPIQFYQVKLRCAQLAVPMHTRTLRGGLDELELSLDLPLSKLCSIHLQTKAMPVTQRQAATAHTSSWSTQQMVQQRTASLGRLVRQGVASCSSCLLKGSLGAMPGCAGWAGGLCQPCRDPAEGSGAVTCHLHDVEPHSRGPTVWCLASHSHISRCPGLLVFARLNDMSYLTGRLKGVKCAPSLITNRACRQVCCPTA